MARKYQKKKRIRQVKFSPAMQEKDGKLVFLPAKDSKVIVEYPIDWPSNIRRLIGIVRVINEETCNVYLWCDQTNQYFGINYRTAPNHGIKVLIEELINDDE